MRNIVINNNHRYYELDIYLPKLNIALARYYKGTALVGVTKKLEEYLDTADPLENNINYL